MSDQKKLSPPGDRDERIEDAEFIEIGNSGPSTDAKNASSDYSTIGWWAEMPMLGKLLAVGALLFFCLMISARMKAPQTASGENRPNGDADASAEVIDTTAQSTTADQMLAQWSQHVTGRPGASGFALVDGSGAAGTSCNDGDGTHLLQFGRSGSATPLVSDFYSTQTAGSDVGVGGAFWFNNQVGELLVRNSHAVDLKRKKDWAVPDKIFRVAGGGDGTVQLDGVAYHFCVMPE